MKLDTPVKLQIYLLDKIIPFNQRFPTGFRHLLIVLMQDNEEATVLDASIVSLQEYVEVHDLSADEMAAIQRFVLQTYKRQYALADTLKVGAITPFMQKYFEEDNIWSAYIADFRMGYYISLRVQPSNKMHIHKGTVAFAAELLVPCIGAHKSFDVLYV